MSLIFNSARSNVFSSNSIAREPHHHGWVGSITVSNPNLENGGHAAVVFTVEGVGCATVAKGQQHVFTLTEKNNNAADRFVVNYLLTEADWGEVPLGFTLTNASTQSANPPEALPYGCIVLQPGSLLAVNECRIDFTTGIQSLTAISVGTSNAVSPLPNVDLEDGSKKYVHISGTDPLVLLGTLPYEQHTEADGTIVVGDPVKSFVFSISSDSLEQSVEAGGALTDATQLYHMHESFPGYRGAGGSKKLSDFLVTQYDTGSGLRQKGTALLMNYTVHRMAQYEATFRGPLQDVIKEFGATVVIDTDVQGAVTLPLAPEKYAFDDMSYLDKKSSGTHWLLLHFPGEGSPPEMVWKKLNFKGIIPALGRCATIEFACTLGGVVSAVTGLDFKLEVEGVPAPPWKYRETNWMNLVTDALLSTYSGDAAADTVVSLGMFEGEKDIGADGVVTSGISYGDVHKAVSGEGRIVMLDVPLTYQQLRDTLEAFLAAYPGVKKGLFPHFAGMTVTINTSDNPGGRVRKIVLANGETAYDNGAAPGGAVKVITGSELVSSVKGPFYPGEETRPSTTDMGFMHAVVIGYIEANPDLSAYAAPAGRLINQDPIPWTLPDPQTFAEWTAELTQGITTAVTAQGATAEEAAQSAQKMVGFATLVNSTAIAGGATPEQALAGAQQAVQQLVPQIAAAEAAAPGSGATILAEAVATARDAARAAGVPVP